MILTLISSLGLSFSIVCFGKSLPTCIAVSYSLPAGVIAAFSFLGIFLASKLCCFFVVWALSLMTEKPIPLQSPDRLEFCRIGLLCSLCFKRGSWELGCHLFQIKATSDWEGVGTWMNKSVRKFPIILNVASCLALCLVVIDFCFLQLLKN